MKSWWLKSLLSCLAVLLALTAGCSGIKAQPEAGAEDDGAPPFTASDPIEIPKGTPFFIRLQEAISSATAQEGQNFAAVLDEPLESAGRQVIPAGAAVTGRVVAVRRSGRLHDAGYLRLTVIAINVKGKAVPVQASSLFVTGGSYRNRNLAWVGGDAGGGTLFGALTDGSKGALIGGAAGGAGGATAAYAIGKKEVGFNAEHRLGFRLIEPAKLD